MKSRALAVLATLLFAAAAHAADPAADAWSKVMSYAPFIAKFDNVVYLDEQQRVISAEAFKQRVMRMDATGTKWTGNVHFKTDAKAPHTLTVSLPSKDELAAESNAALLAQLTKIKDEFAAKFETQVFLDDAGQAISEAEYMKRAIQSESPESLTLNIRFSSNDPKRVTFTLPKKESEVGVPVGPIP